MPCRKQLTLFITNQNEVIEQIRAEFNSLQYSLIAAHVTLCREDELENLQQVISNIKALHWNTSLTITFNAPIRFEQGKGLLLPAAAENKDFDSLRKDVLKGVIGSPRQHHPHITLMHPRNSTCTDKVFDQLKDHPFPTQLSFDSISLIEQHDAGVWQIIDQFPINPFT